MAAKSLRDNLLKVAMARQEQDLAALKSMEEAQNKRAFGDTKGVSIGDSKRDTKGDTCLPKGATIGDSRGDTRGVSRRVTIGDTKPDAKSISIVDSKKQEGDRTFERFRSKDVARTKSEKALWKYLCEHPKIIITRNDLAEEIRVPESSLEKILRRFAERGILSKSKAPGNEGMVLEILPLENAQIPDDGDTRGDTSGVSNGDSIIPSKIDREEKNLSISLEVISLTWPHLAAAGFGPSQLAQIEANLIATGQSTERVLPSLHHAEWELENRAMLDKNGQPVADPCSWVFRSLARTGYYRRPAGYVSPEEQAEKDAEAEAKATSLARQRADLARFEAWRDSLSPDELKNALQGHPGGSRDAWLKRVWKEKHSGLE